jgi:hypothetical protein
MKRVVQIALLAVAATGFSVMGASAAPIAPPTAPVEAASQIQEAGGRHYRRHHRRYHRHYHGPRVYYGPPRYYAYRPYRPYYRDYYYGAPYVGIGLPFINLHIGGHRHHRHHW